MNQYLEQLKSLRAGAAAAELDSPLVRWCLAAIAVILVWVWLLEPLQDWRAGLAEQTERNARKAVRLIALQERATEWAEAEQAATDFLQQQLGLLFMQPSDTAAQSVMQQLLVTVIEARGLRIESQKLIAPEVAPGLGQRIGVAVNMKGNLAQVLQLLDDISNSRHIVEIGNWLMRRERNGDISLQMTVYGYRGELGGIAAGEN